ncbi:hypothetical protein ECC02_005600 [Trypanosoma cruzi]|uniref:Hcy-binding domain-containing protein n=1 Tax=Trypanosoma cruzi TaxID=5693 RepID=A0A7J6Y5J7_TRYCR|nr:hypothetical protein ECC02_005600 [Trypanosoma cruzi]
MSTRQVNGVLIKDGAMGTLLESWDVDYAKAGSMWSSSVLLSEMDLVKRAHRAYIDAGCDVLLTCTYQMHEEGCAASKVTMCELVDRAVQAARHTMPKQKQKGLTEESTAKERRTGGIDVFRYALSSIKDNGQERVVLLAGSLGPYGSFLPGGQEYLGEYSINEAVINSFHARRLEAFLCNVGEKHAFKVDFFLLETFPRLDEALGILSFVNQHEILRTAPFCFSFIAAPVKNPLPENADDDALDNWWNAAASSIRLPDGNTFEGALSELRGNCGTALVGMGCNCSGPLEVSLVATALLHKKRQGTEGPLVLLLYPNSGEKFTDGQWKKPPQQIQTSAAKKLSMRDLKRILARGGGNLITFMKFLLQLLQQRPEATDWLFEIIVCGACCRSTPEDIAALNQLAREEPYLHA